MKIVFAGLFSLFFFGCAHLVSEPETFEIKLKELPSDSRFKQLKPDLFQLALSDASQIKIIKYKFESQKDLETYILNRRMILHQDFQNNIAPYVGLLKSDKSCTERVKLDGEIQKIPGGEYFFLEFPINSERVISECARDDVWGLVTYHFYSCKGSNELFEIRYSRSLKAEPFDIRSYCE